MPPSIIAATAASRASPYYVLGLVSLTALTLAAFTWLSVTTQNNIDAFAAPRPSWPHQWPVVSRPSRSWRPDSAGRTAQGGGRFGGAANDVAGDDSADEEERGGATGEKGAEGAQWRAAAGEIEGSEAAAQVGEWALGEDERFVWYASHSGMSNQVLGLFHALHMAGVLNRTLVLPPKLPHFTSVVQVNIDEAGFRQRAWLVYSKHLASPDYVSMGDVLDIAAIPPALVRTIDLRHFVALHCRCNVSVACGEDATCHGLFRGLTFSNQVCAPSPCHG
ncbi:hypothetical protein CLOM_g3680 [Closterium sp. NIES-68]|nr:hypothetical protein CLOM_g3680 [Closterium sp. NIES-68]